MWSRFLEQNGIEGYYTPVYHQRANPVERRNQEIKKLLRIHLRDKPENRWDEQIREILFTLRNRANAATGIPPSEALLGAQLPAPGEWNHPEVQRPVQNREADREERIRRVRARQEVYARRLYPGGDPPAAFEVGERVLVRAFPGVRSTFGTPWAGPFPIIAVRGNDVYEIDRNGSQVPVHVDDIRPAPRRAANQRDEQPRPNQEDRFLERFQQPEPEPQNVDEPNQNDNNNDAQGEGDFANQPGDRVPGRPRSPPQPALDQRPSTSRDEGVQVQQARVRRLSLCQTLPTIEDCGSDEEETPVKRVDAIPITGLYP